MKKAVVVAAALLFAARGFPQTIFDLVPKGTAAQVREAIKAGMDVNSRNADGMTPLMIAARGNGEPGLVFALARQGADLDTLLASMGNIDPEILSVLVTAGAHVRDVRGGPGETALWFASAFNRNPGVVTFLAQHGAQVNEPEAESGYTPSMAAAAVNVTRKCSRR